MPPRIILVYTTWCGNFHVYIYNILYIVHPLCVCIGINHAVIAFFRTPSQHFIYSFVSKRAPRHLMIIIIISHVPGIVKLYDNNGSNNIYMPFFAQVVIIILCRCHRMYCRPVYFRQSVS